MNEDEIYENEDWNKGLINDTVIRVNHTEPLEFATTAGTGTYTGNRLVLNNTNPYPPYTTISGPIHNEPEISPLDEINIRTSAIENTTRFFGKEEVGVEEFCTVLDAVYNYIRFGTPFRINK